MYEYFKLRKEWTSWSSAVRKRAWNVNKYGKNHASDERAILELIKGDESNKEILKTLCQIQVDQGNRGSQIEQKVYMDEGIQSLIFSYISLF